MKRKKPSNSSPSFGNPEIQQIEQLFQFMTEHNLEEFEYSRGDLHIRLRRPFSGVVVAQPRQGGTENVAANSPAPAGTSGAAAPAEPTEARGTDDLHLIKSPIVGTFYGA